MTPENSGGREERKGTQEHVLAERKSGWLLDASADRNESSFSCSWLRAHIFLHRICDKLTLGESLRKVGQKQFAEEREKVEKRLGVFDDSCAELDKSLKELQLSVQPTAIIPLRVATRGVGFAAVINYSRMCTTWNFDAIYNICTIYQYAMFLVYYKLYKSRYAQGEQPSYDIVSPLVMNEEVRQIIAPITQVPVSTNNIIAAIGKVEGPVIWHSVPVQEIPQNGEALALYLYSDNIGGVLEGLSDRGSPPEVRTSFYNLNPLPGAIWIPDGDNWLLTNTDDIWPANYGAD